MCVRNARGERPSMEDVVGGLEFALQLQQTAENNNINGDPLGGFMDVFSSGNINVGSSTEDDLTTTSGENWSLDTSITTASKD